MSKLSYHKKNCESIIFFFKGIGRLWVEIDHEKKGYINFEEFQQGIIHHNLNFTPNEMIQLFKEFDKNENSNSLIQKLINKLN
jgi:Ca2+-binding EF-hand superfamily protein